MKIDKKILKKIKKNIDKGIYPLIHYYDNGMWALYRDSEEFYESEDIEYDEAILLEGSDGDGYIQEIAEFLIECARNNVDITKFKMETA